MSNGLLYFAGLVALVLAALFAVPHFVDWNGYRGVFEEEATRILGRRVRVGGDVNVRLLPAPYVSFEKLRIADTTSSTGEAFFSAESFTMRLSVPPLLKGIIEANDIELKHPELRLAVDAEGHGNWNEFQIAPGTLPFVPAGVTLQSVNIKDGTVSLHGPKGIGVAVLDGLDGEFKAESIEGPFQFKGKLEWKGAERDVRFATSAIDANGGIRLKTTVRDPEGKSSYVVDARVFDLKGRPSITGDVTAQIQLDPAEMPATSAPQPEAVAVATPPETPTVDFKATLNGDATSLKLDDIAMSFVSVGQPQLISGNAVATWPDDLSIDLNLSSRWLDLDRIASVSGNERPFDIARSFVSALMQALPTQADTKVRFDLDQATLAGDSVSGVRLEVARSGGALVLKDLRAGLPGGSKLALDGSIADAADARSFQGEVSLRGTSLSRFLLWAAKDDAVAEAVGSDGPYSLQGRLALGEHAIDLTNAGAEISGMPLKGEVHYSGGKRTRLGLVVEGHEVDAAKLWPAAVQSFKGVLDKGAKVKAEAAKWFDPATSDFSLRLRAAKLITGHEPLHDVDLDLAIERGQLAMRSGRFSSGSGLTLEMEAAVADVGKTPHGNVHWVLDSPSKDALSDFVHLIDLSDDASAQAMRYADLAPLRLAGTIRLGKRMPSAFDIVADGSVRGGRMIASASLDGGLAKWREAPTDIAMTLQSSDVVQAFDSLTARTETSAGAARERPGEIFFKAEGKPVNGLLATATVKADGLYFAYDGGIAMPESGGSNFNGELRISARELADVMAIAGLGSGGSLRGVPVVGRMKMVSADHAIELKPNQFTVGGSTVDGTLALAYPSGGPAIVTAQLAIDRASIPGLMAIALDRSVTTTGAVEKAPDAEPLTQGQSIWPESAFDFAALDGAEGKLGLSFGWLSLAPGMAIENAQMDVALSPGKISVTKLEGKALGGKVLANVALERAPGGANVTGDVKLTDMQLVSKPADGAAPVKDGEASLSLSFAGRGSTPGGLITVASGNGEIDLGDMSLHVPTPLAVVATSDAVLNGTAGGEGEALVAALRDQIAASNVKVGPRKIGIEIADGAAKLVPFTLDSEAGATKVVTTVDLASLVVDSVWQVEPRAPDVEQPDLPRKGALPAVHVVYTGPLKDAWSMEPTFTADQLERELAIRKMELDAEQLERLHKLDAERARQEEERQRAQEAEEAARAAAKSDDAPVNVEVPVVPPDAVAVPGDPSLPALPPGEASGRGIVVPPAPGQEFDPDPNLNPELSVEGTPGAVAAGQVPGAAAQPEPTPQYRPRRQPPKQIPVSEQVLRALQGLTP